MPFPKLKLSYLDLAGRGEAARLAFFIGGIPFEDDRIQRSDMATRKAEFPYGVVPVLQVNDQVLAESSAIARYAGRLAGLYPTNNPLAAMMVDEIMHAVDEFGESFRPWFVAVDPAVKKEAEATLLKETIPKYLGQIDARLAKLKDHVTFQDDSRLFIHDLWVYQFIRTLLQSDWLAFVPNDIHMPFKHWVAAETKVENHPRVREWNALQSVRPTKLKLTYFGFRGRAEPIRLAFHLGDVAFEDHRIADHAAFEKLKPSLPFGQLPILEINSSVTIGQSYGILRYAGSLSGLYPTSGDDLSSLRIDELLAVLDQLQNQWFPSFKETDPDKQRALREILVNETFPKFLGGLDKRVALWAKPYAIGEKLTIADLAIYGVLDYLKTGMMKHVPAEMVDDFPALIKIYKRVQETPKIQEYYKAKKSDAEA